MEKLPHLQPGQWKLMVLPRQNVPRLLIGMAHLAAQGALTVLDCGRQFDPSIVARAARGRPEVLDRISVRRAFICSEAVRLLERTPAGRAPLIVLDFLSTFYDENVRMQARRYLLESSIRHFQRLSQGAGLVVTLSTLPQQDELYRRLRSSAPRVSVYGTPAPNSTQPGLF